MMIKSLSTGHPPPMDEHELLGTRFWLVVVSGGLVALFGILANGLLTRLFLSGPSFRHSPFFFLGFVALFDTLLDAVYIFLLIPPVLSEYLQLVQLYLLWLQHVKWLYLVGQIFKLSSVFCLIVASFERYLVTSHWTFSGFEERTRWLLLVLVLTLAVAIRFGTTVEVVVLFDGRSQDPFKRYTAGQVSRRDWLPNFLSLLTVIVPFGTLVFLNGGIVLMLRQQNVQQLRSLITELTMGYDFMKVRRRNIRAATHTLLLIISAYLISNLLSLFLSISVFLQPGLLQRNYPHQYRLSSDCASLLTVFGNALRFPAHFCSNGEVREHCRAIFCARKKIPTVASSSKPALSALQLRRYSERLENPWFSALLTARPPAAASAARRISRVGQALLEGRKKRNNNTNNSNANNHLSKGTAELEAYVNGGLGPTGVKCAGAADGSRLHVPATAGFCAVCNGQLEDGSCCSGGAMGTERESLYDEYFTGEQQQQEGDDDEQQQRRLLLMESVREDDDELLEEEGELSSGTTQSEEGEESTKPPADEFDFSQLRFDPAEFASLAMAI